MPEEHDDKPPEPLAWDRVGQFLQDMAAVSQGIAKRNQDLWTQVSGNLRGGDYPADAWSSDAARAMTVAMDNLEDLWTFFTRPPEREQVATSLPTVFLRFRSVDGIWGVQDPVWIRVPYWERDSLPAQADVHLEGDPERTRRLRDSLRAELVGKAYLLTVADVEGLEPGVYSGIVAAGDRALANLLIVVEDG